VLDDPSLPLCATGPCLRRRTSKADTREIAVVWEKRFDELRE